MKTSAVKNSAELLRGVKKVRMCFSAVLLCSGFFDISDCSAARYQSKTTLCLRLSHSGLSSLDSCSSNARRLCSQRSKNPTAGTETGSALSMIARVLGLCPILCPVAACVACFDWRDRARTPYKYRRISLRTNVAKLLIYRAVSPLEQQVGGSNLSGRGHLHSASTVNILWPPKAGRDNRKLKITLDLSTGEIRNTACDKYSCAGK